MMLIIMLMLMIVSIVEQNQSHHAINQNQPTPQNVMLCERQSLPQTQTKCAPQVLGFFGCLCLFKVDLDLQHYCTYLLCVGLVKGEICSKLE